jgi:hypothetical protein
LSTRGDRDSVGWFASAGDILQLDPARWTTTWRKGETGSGALARAYFATTRTGHSYAVVVLAGNPYQPIDGNKASPVILSAINGAFTLASRSPSAQPESHGG